MKYLLLLLSLSACTSVPIVTTPITLRPGAIYVSPTGLDTQSGLSSMKPVQTLEHARDLAELNSGVVYVMGGTYVRTEALYLGPKDAGQLWFGYPGAKPVLDGGDAVGLVGAPNGISINVNNITVRGLTIQNFAWQGIKAGGEINGLYIDSNRIQNVGQSFKGDPNAGEWDNCDRNLGSPTGSGCIRAIDLWTGSGPTVVSHNRIDVSAYAGIEITANPPSTSILVDSNLISNTCLLADDCGAIYMGDRLHASIGTTFSNNVITNWGVDQTPQSKAIYLDDGLSNVNVVNNVVSGTGGQWAIQYHGGDHNRVSNNSFDLTKAHQLGFYQASSPDYGMAGNTFACNQVTSPLTQAQLWNTSVNSTDAPLLITSGCFKAIDVSKVGPLKNTGF